VDDAYISFAYALHLSTGRGLRLSSFGAPVEAFSDPLWVFLLATGHVLGLPIPTTALVLGLVLVGLTAGVTSAVIHAINPDTPAVLRVIPGLLFAVLPATAFAAVTGLETLLFAFLLGCALLLWLVDFQGHRTMSPRAHLCCLLLALTRPEGVLIWAVLVTLTMAYTRSIRRHLGQAMYFIAPAVILEIARLVYFGQALPNSIVAKSGYSRTISRQLIKGHTAAFWHQYWPILLAAALVAILSWIDWSWLPWLRPVTVLVLVLGFFEILASPGDGYPYQRYLYCGLPLLLILVAAGLAGLAWGPRRHRLIPTRRGRQSTIRVLVSAGLAGVLLLSGLVASGRAMPLSKDYFGVRSSTGNHLASLFAPDHLSKHIGSTYHYSLAALLNSSGRSPLVATNEVGIVSYYTHARIIDLYGLGNSHVSHLKGQPGDRPDPAYVFGLRPDYIVLLVGGCLCLGVPSDVTYASSDGIDSYHIVDLLYDGPAGPRPLAGSGLAAVVFGRDDSIDSITPLDQEIPSALLTRTLMPPPVEDALDADLPYDPTSGIGHPSSQLVSAGSLALGDFAALRPNETTSIGLPPTAVNGPNCAFAATAISTGSLSTGMVSVALSVRASTKSVVVQVPPRSVRTLSVPLPSDAGPLGIQVHTDTHTILADPTVTCRH
jgi:hypothetical protein